MNDVQKPIKGGANKIKCQVWSELINYASKKVCFFVSITK